MLNCIKEALITDEQYIIWSENRSDSWMPRVVRQYGACGNQRTAEQLQVYSDVYLASMWNNLRAFRIHLHEVLLHCYDLASAHPYAQLLSIDATETRMRSHAIISEMIDGICKSVPFCMGDIDRQGREVARKENWMEEAKEMGGGLPLGGYLLLFPLNVARWSCASLEDDEMATSTRMVDDVKAKWIQNVQFRISNEMGLRQGYFLAVSLRPKERWDIRTKTREAENAENPYKMEAELKLREEGWFL